MNTITNPFQACLQVFIKPREVFTTLNHKHNWSWIPFILVMLAAVLPMYSYLNFVDFAWYKHAVIELTAGDLSPAEQDSMKAMMGSQASYTTGYIIGMSLGVIAAMAVFAGYLHLVTRSDEQNLNGFTDWYGFTWWVSLPTVISCLLALLMLALSSTNQIHLIQLDIVSLSYWLGLDMSSTWIAVTDLIRLDTLFSIYLTAVGISRWTQFSNRRVYLLALLPYTVILSIALLVTLV
ncbi:YIP1 family protein [Aliiglaciecola sp. LCG003]|uniref:YIP1 family protein n=1 Tax=Aliiglaciecola sp. LCG003 TaxID=3053655 RepID=UPI002574143B|nr:YIP1 family protein [Aliiglaciecola sp. LCG003]WJG08268.1 YIP1 family protein [Aliiglaciecola sp. LCG003]